MIFIEQPPPPSNSVKATKAISMPLLCFRHTTQKDFGQQLNWEENTQPMASILPGKGWASGHYPNPVNQKPAASTARRQATEKYTLKNPVTVQELLDNIFFLRCQSICHHWWLTCKEHKEILVHQSNHSWKTNQAAIFEVQYVQSGNYFMPVLCAFLILAQDEKQANDWTMMEWIFTSIW